jgi:excisionase family DNA binding protein
MFTVRQAAERLNCSVAIVYQLCGKRLLRHARIGLGRGKIVIPEDAITEYLKSREVSTVGPTPPPLPRPAGGDGFLDYYLKIMDQVARRQRR